MEFQKLQKIIGDVLEVDPEEIGIRIPGQAVRQILTVKDAAEQIRQTVSQ